MESIEEQHGIQMNKCIKCEHPLYRASNPVGEPTRFMVTLNNELLNKLLIVDLEECK